MLSFHNDQSIKEKYLSRVIKNRELDNIIQGTGWENGKGCAVGCTLESYDHSRYPIELGIPIWLAYLEDKIFENLPKELAVTWPERFLSSIPVGVNIELVRNKLDIRRLNRLIELQEKNDISSDLKNEIIDSIRGVILCHENFINSVNSKSSWSEAESAARSSAESAAWSEAESAAWSAARSAESAARSAAWSAAWSAARSAESAARSAAWSAAWSAARSAESAAWSAARSAARSAESAAWSEAESAAWSEESAARSASFIKESEDLLEELMDLK